MIDEIKQEAIEQVELDIKFGFENEQQLFESIRDMFYQEEDFDDDWLMTVIAERYKQHQEQSATWTHPTDFDRLANTFDALILEGIVCLHKAGYTKSDGIEDCMYTIAQLVERDIKAAGFCYYHAQDLGRAVDPQERNLFLGFDSPTQDDVETIRVGKRIVEKLKQNGFEVDWPETVEQRIEIKNIDWKKVPDNQDWGQGRVIQLLSERKTSKRPFWKFW
jgi:hypothetical protein